MKNLFIVIFLFTSFLTGCATTNQRVLDSGNETQLQKRSYQSRIFDTTDKEKVLRATISTLQDLGFVIDRADLVLGSVSGTKLDGHQIKITVSVRPKGSDRMLVRANAQFNITPIEDPKHYQDFFSSLEKSLFLVAHAGE
ncbi:hypothetical protein [Agitococcus lubricus]|jgi:hypothetical protein|uniref:Uncharacterized protein n=1 Tax=Agitococcus lubricus TaxID=1077255 RepID=A0A2T5IZS3_9GAMM|nr:hypothetical protein [Agitococcus lubricus]MCB1659823.1 hypothetical protein [Pseudomonadales bacterium]PTQ89484.1 hypothetical protein C8N29_10615 [Agitococcus lubricus]